MASTVSKNDIVLTTWHPPSGSVQRVIAGFPRPKILMIPGDGGFSRDPPGRRWVHFFQGQLVGTKPWSPDRLQIGPALYTVQAAAEAHP